MSESMLWAFKKESKLWRQYLFKRWAYPLTFYQRNCRPRSPGVSRLARNQKEFLLYPCLLVPASVKWFHQPRCVWHCDPLTYLLDEDFAPFELEGLFEILEFRHHNQGANPASSIFMGAALDDQKP